jgi:hypothetical protein
MWRITAETPADRPHVVPDESAGVEVEVAR